MTRKRILLVALFLFLAVSLLIAKLIWPYLGFGFMKDLLFPPPGGLDGLTGATLPAYTPGMTKEALFEHIRSGGGNVMAVTGTVNGDGTAQAGVLTLGVEASDLILSASPDDPTLMNIRRDKRAVVTVYLPPAEGIKWHRHRGVRIWLKWTGKSSTGADKSALHLRLIGIRPL